MVWYCMVEVCEGAPAKDLSPPTKEIGNGPTADTDEKTDKQYRGCLAI